MEDMFDFIGDKQTLFLIQSNIVDGWNGWDETDGAVDYNLGEWVSQQVVR